MEQLTDSIPCLAQPVTQVQASRYHTLQGISQFLKEGHRHSTDCTFLLHKLPTRKELKRTFIPKAI